MNNDKFYAFAKAYDIAFSDRDYDKEAEFINWLYENFSPLRYKESPQERNFIELGCGPARHSIAMSKLGWNATGLDLSAEMLEYARELAKQNQANLKLIKANMIDFETEEKYSVAACFTESITHILNNDDMLKHLESVARQLKRGGLYIIENAHPRFFFPPDEANVWETEKDNIRVKVLFGTPRDQYDSIGQIWDITTRLIIKIPGEKSIIVKNKSKHRWYLASEYDLFYRLSPQYNGIYFFGNMDIPPDSLNENSECMIVCLRRK